MFFDDIFGESPAAISKMVSVIEASFQILGCSFLKFSHCLGTRSMHACYLGLLSDILLEFAIGILLYIGGINIVLTIATIITFSLLSLLLLKC